MCTHETAGWNNVNLFLVERNLFKGNIVGFAILHLPVDNWKSVYRESGSKKVVIIFHVAQVTFSKLLSKCSHTTHRTWRVFSMIKGIHHMDKQIDFGGRKYRLYENMRQRIHYTFGSWETMRNRIETNGATIKTNNNSISGQQLVESFVMENKDHLSCLVHTMVTNGFGIQGASARFQCPIRRLIVRFRVGSKPALLLNLKGAKTVVLPICLSNFRAIRQNSKYISHGFKTSRDLTIRRLIGYWNSAQGINNHVVNLVN